VFDGVFCLVAKRLEMNYGAFAAAHLDPPPGMSLLDQFIDVLVTSATTWVLMPNADVN
jgi:hypothetical protein